MYRDLILNRISSDSMFVEIPNNSPFEHIERRARGRSKWHCSLSDDLVHVPETCVCFSTHNLLFVLYPSLKARKLYLEFVDTYAINYTGICKQ